MDMLNWRAARWRPGSLGSRLAPLALALLCLLPIGARGTLTSPTLLITSVDSEASVKRTLVRLEGRFPYSDMVQQPYAMNLFIRELEKGEEFVCYAMWNVFVGKDKMLEDGLDRDDAFALEGIVEPAESGHMLHIGPRHIHVELPEGFKAGPAEAVLWVWYEGEPVFSNAFEFEIEEAKW